MELTEWEVFNWFANNVATTVDFYNSLHIHNLDMIYRSATQHIKHMLLPDSWPIESAWSFDLLQASIKGACNNPVMQKRLSDWHNLENSN